MEIKGILTITFIVAFLSCNKSDMTLTSRYGVDPVQLEFISFGLELQLESQLYINLKEETFSIYLSNELYHQGNISDEIKSNLIQSIGALKSSQVDRIFNPNSADNTLFHMRFWGEDVDYAHGILSYGHTQAPQEVVEVIHVIRKTMRTLGRSKTE